MKITENKVLCAALVFLAAFFAYANSVNPTFHWEDEYLVRDNVHIRRLTNLPAFFRPGYINVYESGAGHRYRPLRTVTLALDYALWKGDPRGYHLSNVLLNCGAALMFWLFCLALTGNGLLALLAGLLFALHPAHAESVAWVKNRSDILCALFYFASAAAFAFYARHGKKTALAASVLLAAPAFLAKEMALTLPFALALALVYSNLEAGKDWKEKWEALVPFFALLAAYVVFRETAMAGGPAAIGAGAAPLARAQLLAVTAGEYLKTLLWPVTLSIDRALPSGGAAALQYGLAAVFIAGVPGLWFSGRRRGAFWLLLFWVLYVPISNLVLIEGRPFAEQRLYLPSAAFCAFIAWALTELPRPGSRLARASLGFALALGLFWGARGAYRNLDWKSEVGLWQKTAASSPSARVYNNLAVALLRENRYEEGIRNAQESLRLDPAFVDAWNTLGAGYHDLKLYDRSISAFEKAVYFSDGRAYKSVMNLAALYSLKGRWQEALAAYQSVLKTAPWMDAAYYNMGLALAQQKRPDEALRAFSEALALNPYNAQAYLMMGRILDEKGDRAGAARVYADLLRIEPGNQQASAYLQANPPGIDSSRATP
ncbi:MAG: hypothetical protein A2X35_11950 [Elusimicrobia bacterium GWA2_61_42]|nr:MAG: hypothetical protein A2X35_11950 [Elusimicrobia bacterium GWA2_61_42]OGR76360.1 MAG: hypothetical protein A2X38_01120 [Elusimicrobia bacterium GWC2_61_25]